MVSLPEGFSTKSMVRCGAKDVVVGVHPAFLRALRPCEVLRDSLVWMFAGKSSAMVLSSWVVIVR